MSKAPELLENTGESTGPIGASTARGRDLGEAAKVGFDSAHAHARRLLEACHVSPDLLPPAATIPPHPAHEWAASGAMALTGPADGPPRFAAGPLASVARGAAVALRALGGHTRRPLLDGPALLGERAALFGLSRQGQRSAGGSARLLTTRDGVLAINLPRDDDWRLVPAWLADCELAGMESGAFDPAVPIEDRWRQIARGVERASGAELVERGRLIGLAVAPAPSIDSQAASVPPALFALHAESETPPRTRPRPLRLLDLSTLWAGPLATSLLADIGVDVLKVESPNRPDGARSGPKGFFDLMNGGKRGCALDLRDGRDRARFERLLASADVVVESARPRALTQLGYDPLTWVGERPGRLWTSITGYGRSREWIAFGDDAAIAAGLGTSPLAEETDACFCSDAVADPLTGLHVAVFVLALWRAGRGGLLDVSLEGIARCAARATHEGVTLPTESEAERYVVVEDTRRQPVRSPRARAIQRAAPTLEAPSDERISDWADRPC